MGLFRSILKLTALAVISAVFLCGHAKADNPFYDQFFDRFVKTTMAGQPFDLAGMSELGEDAGAFKGSFLADDQSLMAVMAAKPGIQTVSAVAYLSEDGSSLRTFGKVDDFSTTLHYRSEVDGIAKSFDDWLNGTPGVMERSKCSGKPEEPATKDTVFWKVGTFKTPDGTPATFALTIRDISVKEYEPPSPSGSRFVFMVLGVGESAGCTDAP